MHRRQHLQPSAPWASIDIAEPGDEHVAYQHPRPRFSPDGPILAQTSDLAISLFATSANAQYADARHRTMLDRIKGYLETRFRDPGLTPDEIAAAANISTRYLHKLFEGEHETVALYLRGLRLQHARDDLLDPRLASRSVAAIAHGCGFGDVSGFNRSFKRDQPEGHATRHLGCPPDTPNHESRRERFRRSEAIWP